MRRKFLLLAAALGLCTCVLMACRGKPAFDAGEELSAEELEALRVSLQEKEEGSDGASDSQNTPADQNPPSDGGFEENKSVFYYTESGEVYHSDRDCSHLKKSDNVKSGTIDQAEQAGKTRLCSDCAQKPKGEGTLGNEADGSNGGNGENKTIFYYAVSGETYHFDRNCSYLRNSNTVLEGSAEDALAAGKIHPCSRCGD